MSFVFFNFEIICSVILGNLQCFFIFDLRMGILVRFVINFVMSGIQLFLYMDDFIQWFYFIFVIYFKFSMFGFYNVGERIGSQEEEV